MRVLIGSLALVLSLATATAQTSPPLTVEQRIGVEVGPILVRSAVLGVQNEQMQSTIADLQRQIGELKKKISDTKPPEDSK